MLYCVCFYYWMFPTYIVPTSNSLFWPGASSLPTMLQQGHSPPIIVYENLSYDTTNTLFVARLLFSLPLYLFSAHILGSVLFVLLVNNTPLAPSFSSFPPPFLPSTPTTSHYHTEKIYDFVGKVITLFYFTSYHVSPT